MQIHTEVGLIGAILGHGVIIEHDREGILEIHIQDLFEDGANELFHQRTNFVHGEEGGFDIDLRKFRLAVRTKVLIAEAFDNLIIAVKTSAHEQLLKQLRRLWQSIETAILDTRRNEIVTGSFWSGAR